jgi:hypothetical protein
MLFLHNALIFQICLFVFEIFINNIDALQGTKKQSLQKFGILPLLNFISSCLLPKFFFFAWNKLCDTTKHEFMLEVVLSH